MALIDNNQDLRETVHRILISESFPEPEYSLFRDYCASSNFLFVDELEPADYVAFQTQFKLDKEFVRKIRSKVEAAKSDKSISTSATKNPEPVTSDLEVDSSSHDEKLEISWDQSIQATAEAYMNCGGPKKLDKKTG